MLCVLCMCLSVCGYGAAPLPLRTCTSVGYPACSMARTAAVLPHRAAATSGTAPSLDMMSTSLVLGSVTSTSWGWGGGGGTGGVGVEG